MRQFCRWMMEAELELTALHKVFFLLFCLFSLSINFILVLFPRWMMEAELKLTALLNVCLIR
jgi:hypothetical protein